MHPRFAHLLPWLVLVSCHEPAKETEPAADAEPPVTVEPSPTQPVPGDGIVRHLNRIVIPVIDFEGLTLEEALDYLRVRSIELDPDPDRRGVSIVTRRPGGDPSDAQRGLWKTTQPRRLGRFFAQRVTLPDAIAMSCELVGADAYLTSVGMVVCPRGASAFPNPKASKGEVWKRLVPTGPDTSLAGQLGHIVIPRIDFEQCSIDEAVDYCRLRSAELDLANAGVQFVVMHPGPDGGTAIHAEGLMESWIGCGPSIPRYQDRDVPLRRAIQRLCELTGYEAYLASIGVVLCGPGVIPFADAEGKPPESWVLLSDAP